MKKFKNNFLNALIKCWRKISISDKALQIIVALTVCIISLLSLIIGNSFDLIPSSANPIVI